MLNWFLYRGLVRYGYDELAGRVRTALIELPRQFGFWEHYSPGNGGGHGGEDFSWTAALLLDSTTNRSKKKEGARDDGSRPAR